MQKPNCYVHNNDHFQVSTHQPHSLCYQTVKRDKHMYYLVSIFHAGYPTRFIWSSKGFIPLKQVNVYRSQKLQNHVSYNGKFNTLFMPPCLIYDYN